MFHDARVDVKSGSHFPNRRKNGVPGIREEFGLAADAPLIVMLSRLNRLKGVEYFLEAAASVLFRFPNARFAIVGDVAPTGLAYRDELKRHTQRLGIADRVVFTGFRSDIPQLLAETDISVLPSLSEGALYAAQNPSRRACRSLPPTLAATRK